MLPIGRDRVVSTSGNGAKVTLAGGDGISWLTEQGTVALIPDLSDPATLGCLLALVEESYPGRIALVPLQRDRWGLAVPSPIRSGPRFPAATRAEVCVLALEAAPEVAP